MGVSYFTQSGSEYSVDANGMLVKNGALETVDGQTFRYIGIVDRKYAEDVLRNDGRRWPPPVLLFVLKGKLNITQVAFADVKSHIDGKVALVYCNDDLEQLIMTSPLRN